MSQTCFSCGASQGPFTGVTIQLKGLGLKRVPVCQACMLTVSASQRAAPPRRDPEGVIAELFGEEFRYSTFESFQTGGEVFAAHEEAVAGYYARLKGQTRSLKAKESLEVDRARECYGQKDFALLQKAKESAERFAQKALSLRAGRLVLSGPTGVGKTHLAAAIARLLLGDGLRLDAVMGYEFAMRIQDTFSRARAGAEETKVGIVEGLAAADAVVIDNISGVNFTPFTRQFFAYLIDELTRREKILLITTSKSPGELAHEEEGVGHETMDRLRRAPSFFIDLQVPSYRTLTARLQDLD